MRHRRPVFFERFVFGTALLLAAILLFFFAQRTLDGRSGGAERAAGGPKDPPPLDTETYGGTGTKDGVLNLPPLKVAGVGGVNRRKSAEPPAPGKR